MAIFIPLIAVVALALVAFVGAELAGLRFLFGVIIPGVALAVFVVGIIYRVIGWARVPVPFRIPTSCGQQKSLPWIRQAKFDNPFTLTQVLGRMGLEVFFFRSLFRNTKAKLPRNERLVYYGSKYLWAGAMAFHWGFLLVILRHFRFFAEPVPAFVTVLQNVDGFMQVGLPVFYISSLLLLAGLGYLLFRRVAEAQVRVISLAADYFALFLLLGIAGSGFLMRHLFKVDLLRVKEVSAGWMSLNPVTPEAGIGAWFYIHIFLVSVLLLYFPFSKLMHMAGVFFSPARNLANNNRAKHHENPWDYPVNVHTYEEWEEEFKDKIVAAGLPLDKE